MRLLKNRLVFVVAALAACGLPGCGVYPLVEVSNLEWQPLVLSSSGCPNLSGEYVYSVTRLANGGYITNLDPIYAGSIFALRRTARVDPSTGLPQAPVSAANLPDYQSYYVKRASRETKRGIVEANPITTSGGVFYIEHTRTSFIQESAGSQIYTRVGTTMTGCHGGSLILRNMQQFGGQEFTPRLIRYGEIEIQRGNDESLRVTYRRRQRPLSATGILGDSVAEPPVVRIYPSSRR